MQSKAATVEEYLKSLPEDRRESISAIRDVIRKNLGKGFEEGMTYGMIGYYVPHSIYPAGYHCDPSKPLPYINLASQKNHLSLYMMGLYVGPDKGKRFVDAWKKTGKKLDIGKVCIRGKKLDDFALDVIGDTVSRVSVEEYIKVFEAAIKGAGKAKAARKAAKNTTAAKKPTPKAELKKRVTARKG